jgi:hypothetical protein
MTEDRPRRLWERKAEGSSTVSGAGRKETRPSPRSFRNTIDANWITAFRSGNMCSKAIWKAQQESVHEDHQILSEVPQPAPVRHKKKVDLTKKWKRAKTQSASISNSPLMRNVIARSMNLSNQV